MITSLGEETREMKKKDKILRDKLYEEIRAEIESEIASQNSPEAYPDLPLQEEEEKARSP